MKHLKYEHMTDVELVVASQKRDSHAFNRLMKKYTTFITRYISQRAGNTSDLDDLIQEVYIRIWKSIKGLRNPLLFKSWLGRVIANMVNDYYRTVQIQRNHLCYSLDEPIGRDDNPDTHVSLLAAPSKWNADKSAIFQENCNELDHILSQIDTNFCVPLVRACNGESYASISEDLGICMGTIKSRIARGKKKFKSNPQAESLRGTW